jgi:hypothetical protein
MADAFGLGGLPALRIDSAEGETLPSPVEAGEVVSFYGSPRTPSMGLLGQHEPGDLAALLRQSVDRFDELNASRPAIAALHVVYAVAQPEAHDGTYLRYVDDRTVRQYLDLARRQGFVLILDLQIGHSSALEEVFRIERWLAEPDVFVALDPEFALAGRDAPGAAIGDISGDDINAVQWYLAQFSATRGLPAKMLVVHQFESSMIRESARIERTSGVSLVIDMDGYGPADVKEAKYHRYGGAPYAPFGGIKVFLEHDPDPLSPEELFALQPPPSLVVYQ